MFFTDSHYNKSLSFLIPHCITVRHSMEEMNGWTVILISLGFLAYAQDSTQPSITHLLIIKHTHTTQSLFLFLNLCDLTRWQSQPDRCVLKTHLNICK